MNTSIKEISISDRILTNKGWIPVKDINKDCKLVNNDSNIIELLEVKDCKEEAYKISFIDGTSCILGAGHGLLTLNISKRYPIEYVTRNIVELTNGNIVHRSYDKRYNTYQNRYKFAIPNTNKLYYGLESKCAIDPYLLGLLLGDGGFTNSNIMFTNGDNDIVSKFKSLITDMGYRIAESYIGGASHIRVSGSVNGLLFKELILELGLYGHYSYDKFIPNRYLNNVYTVRNSIYKGLVDTDGSIDNLGRLSEYSTSSKKLALGFLDLGRSLGITLNRKKRLPKYKYKGEAKVGKESYRIRQLNKKYKSIIDISPVGKRSFKCLSLVGDEKNCIINDYIVV